MLLLFPRRNIYAINHLKCPVFNHKSQTQDLTFLFNDGFLSFTTRHTFLGTGTFILFFQFFMWLVSMSDKELKRLSILQEICDQRITQSQAIQLLHILEPQITRWLQTYKAQGPAALANATRGQRNNSTLTEELRLKCLNIVAEQFHGFESTLVYGIRDLIYL